MTGESVPDVDWSRHEGLSESTVSCRCGAEWRSHAKLVSTGASFVPVARKPCPACGRHTDVWHIADDPEIMML
jgi:hypothetical protein